MAENPLGYWLKKKKKDELIALILDLIPKMCCNVPNCNCKEEEE